MVDSLTTYCDALRSGITLFDALASIYTTDSQKSDGWASRTLMQIANQRMNLAERLAEPELTAEEAVTLLTTIDRYMDSHWADYVELPTSDPAKRAQVLELHNGLTGVLNEVGALYNSLRETA